MNQSQFQYERTLEQVWRVNSQTRTNTSKFWKEGFCHVLWLFDSDIITSMKIEYSLVRTKKSFGIWLGCIYPGHHVVPKYISHDGMSKVS